MSWRDVRLRALHASPVQLDPLPASARRRHRRGRGLVGIAPARGEAVGRARRLGLPAALRRRLALHGLDDRPRRAPAPPRGGHRERATRAAGCRSSWRWRCRCPTARAARREEARIKALDRRAKARADRRARRWLSVWVPNTAGDAGSVGRCRSNVAPEPFGRTATHDMPTTEFPAVTDDAQATNGHVKVERRERVIVRFAGDSGDGMQLAGGRFTDATAVVRQRPGDAAELPGRDPRARRQPRRRLELPDPLRRARHRDAGRHAQRARGHEPGGAAGQRRASSSAARRSSSTRTRSPRATCRRRLRGEPARGRLARRLPGQARADDDARQPRGRGARGRDHARRPAGAQPLRARPRLAGSTTARPRSPSAGSRASSPTSRRVRDVNLAAFRAGWNFGETSELIDVRYEVAPATDVPPGVYRNVNGTTTTALGPAGRAACAAGCRSCSPPTRSRRPPSCCTTSRAASRRRRAHDPGRGRDRRRRHRAGRRLRRRARRDRDERPRAGPQGRDDRPGGRRSSCRWSSSTSSAPARRPACRPRPSSPTCWWRSTAATASRRCRSSPPRRPGSCFDAAYEAVRIAVRYRTPVILLTDLFLANGSEPWRIPQAAVAAGHRSRLRAERRATARPSCPTRATTTARARGRSPARPGWRTASAASRSTTSPARSATTPANHARMTALRAAKVAGIEVPDVEVDHEDGAELLVLGWGSSEGALRAGVRRVRQGGRKVARAHLHHLNPLPANLGEVLRAYPRVLLPEMNSGQLARVLRAEYLVDVQRLLARRGPPAVRRRDRAGDPGDAAVSTAPPLPLTKADFQSDQETRWCPGCGDYSVLAAVQGFMPELGIPPERIVFVTGIGCAGRFSYYMNTYGMHAIHGRAPTIATGLAAARDDLSVWIVSGDGDALSIGANHLVHALRRNVPVKILLFNNRIYGLTKGQASPTSELGKVTKSTPRGSIDPPLDALSLALGAGATFVARTVDRDKQGLRRGAARGGRASAAPRSSRSSRTARCSTTARSTTSPTRTRAAVNRISLVDGQPIRFGARPRARRRAATTTARWAWRRVDEVGAERLVVHDATLRGPVARLRPRPPRRPGRRAGAARRLPRGRRAAVGRRPRGRAARRARGAGRRRPRRPAARGRHLDHRGLSATRAPPGAASRASPRSAARRPGGARRR